MKNMGDGRRVSRVENEVQRLVAQYIITQLRGEFPGIVTVSRVKMPADLRTANIYISIINHDGKFDGIIESLQGFAPEIQKYINENMRTRYCPKLTFFEDDVTQKVIKVEQLLKEIKDSEKKENS